MQLLWSLPSLLLLAGGALSFQLNPRQNARRAPVSGSKLDAVENLGIVGGGTVGGGIVEILESNRDLFTRMTGKEINVARLAVRDMGKPRDFDTPSSVVVSDNFQDILNDDSIDTVVEVMGGTTLAKDVVFDALKAGKNVVTANKALIADCLVEIEDLVNSVNAKRGSEKPVEFRYEAAVCGGIPIISSLQGDFVGDEITMVTGIINGCTNYMLTSMDRDGLSYEESLKGASELGYAEADPTLDVGGFDARSKLKILIRLAFGIDVSEDEISCKGIPDLTKEDFEYARMLGGTIKLTGVAKKVADGNIAAFVSPTYVDDEDTLASIAGATNAVEVQSKNLVRSTYTGQGAGRYPTANSCINDIVKVARGDVNPLPFNSKNTDGVKFVNDYKSKFYVRLRYRDMNGITKDCGQLCADNDIGIYSILQNPIKNRNDAAFVIITESVKLSQVKKFVSAIEGLDWCRGDVFFMPLLRDEDVGA
mmetsp:Transcript_21205/g.44253  ORF Transcript_21205/g.44253 Transcript_21205/m.44253 type:complete len:479 (+) Transcript_21205:53-1489(+)|eukprot:CAMPEP_0197552482 /NCGR_PEP_ID=MMETSP1320-20131121/5941_1 /TAXON_ID=91990 /ORGANISM="Bolidomonas sp., Strain RCC2347" /LENGTH=478 /DNA_ID=CAMNT_0043113063 /DNA_START=60 /DNA_END=1496 /DNA_ORIENTATION=-